MSIFTTQEIKDYSGKQKVYKLSRDGKCFLDQFTEEIKKDNNLKPELGNLVAIVKEVAKDPNLNLPKSKYRKENIGKKMPFTVYAAKSKHLRLYMFTDPSGMVIVLGGKKTDQPSDLKRIETIVKEYSEYIKRNRKDA
jgi:hypothetical protein